MADDAPRGLDPLRGTLTITNWGRFGIYDVAFSGERPSLFAPTGDAPFPWVSTLFEGPNDQGFIFGASLPSNIIAELTSADRLSDLHRCCAAATGTLPFEDPRGGQDAVSVRAHRAMGLGNNP